MGGISRRFSVVTTQRSGSVFFESILNSTGVIYCYPEIFYPDNIHNTWCFYNFWLKKIEEDRYNITHFRIKEILREYFDFVFDSASDREAVGVDIKYNHFDLFPYQTEVIAEKIGKMIHLVRKNILKTQISFLICERRKELGIESHVTSEVELPRLVLPLDEKLIRVLKLRRNQIVNFRKMLQRKFDYLEIYYEDLRGNGIEEVLKKIYRFLDIKDNNCSYRTELKKITPDNLEELIENYSEFESFLEHYGFGYLLYFTDSPVPGLEWESVDDKEGLLILGRDFLRQGDYESALKCFYKILKRTPGDREIVLLLGKILEKFGRYVEALGIYKDFSLLYPEDEEIKLRILKLERVCGEDVEKRGLRV